VNKEQITKKAGWGLYQVPTFARLPKLLKTIHHQLKIKKQT